jgi:hypothetical protein
MSSTNVNLSLPPRPPVLFNNRTITGGVVTALPSNIQQAPGIHGYAAGVLTGVAKSSGWLNSQDITYSPSSSAVKISDLLGFTQARLQASDTNNNGTLEQSETTAQAGKGNVTLDNRTFRLADLNRDNKLDGSELASLYALSDGINGTPEGKLTLAKDAQTQQFLQNNPLQARRYLGQIRSQLNLGTAYTNYTTTAETADVKAAKKTVTDVTNFFKDYIPQRPTLPPNTPAPLPGLDNIFDFFGAGGSTGTTAPTTNTQAPDDDYDWFWPTDNTTTGNTNTSNNTSNNTSASPAIDANQLLSLLLNYGQTSNTGSTPPANSGSGGSSQNPLLTAILTILSLAMRSLQPQQS